jgi:hypothetical protein
MADMEFDTNPNEFGRPPEKSAGSDLTGKLIRWGLVSTRTEAEYVLGAVGVVAIIAMIIIIKRSF